MSSRALVLVIGVALAIGCRHSPSTPNNTNNTSLSRPAGGGLVDGVDRDQGQDHWQLGLARESYGGGSKWRFMVFKPPYIYGPDDSLRLAKDAITGITSGAALEIKLSEKEATGFIGQQPVQLDIFEENGVIQVEGTFGGAYVSFVADEERIRASVPRNGRRGRFTCCSEYILERRPSQETAMPGFLVYIDDQRGISLPRWRLEIPQVLFATYTGRELALIMMILMS